MRAVILATTVAVILTVLTIIGPVSAQQPGTRTQYNTQEKWDINAIRYILGQYEESFNERDIEKRMSLCLDSYQEHAFEYGRFRHVRDFDETREEVGKYWASVRKLEYSLTILDIGLDGPMAHVRAYTTHLSDNDRHSSVVHFHMLRINELWYIAWDSYNVVRRFESTQAR